MKFATKAIHIGEEPNLKEGGSGDVAVPIHLSSTFARKDVDRPTGGYEYSRSGNPTRDALEKRLAALENAKYGLAFGSGLGAETTLALSLLKTGDHVIGFDDLYGGTKRLFNQTIANFGVEFTYVDATRVENVEEAIRPQTKLIWLESPTNPLMKLCDIRAISKLAKERNILTVVDNTFMSPYFQSPLDLGADIVLHSTTKYIGGHSDVVGGAVMLSDEEAYRKIKFNQNAIGTVPSPFDCFLVLRGIKTLAVRMERHNENGQRIAKYLESHPKVKKVNYPGLTSYAQHDLAKRQMSGSGGMLSFELDADLANVKAVLSKFRIFALAESLGGVESLIEHPASMTHASVARKEREKIGITDSLVRLSVGIEDADDLIEDLKYALSFA
ncbi:MAG TPA: PLP-dependent aspartate aminotransferase family protein [Methanocellaceae archaeon]